MKLIGGILAAALAAAALVSAAAPAPRAGRTAKPLVFTVGYTQDIDSFNPTVGVTVAAYEAWNIQYATLTDKAAKDFSVTPGLAESWESSADKQDLDLQAAPGHEVVRRQAAHLRGHRLHDQPLARGGVDQPQRGRREHHRQGDRPDSRSSSSRRCRTRSCPSMDVYIVPKHIYEKYDKKAIKKYDGQDGVGSGPFTLVGVQEGPVRALRGEPELLARQAAARRRRDPQLQQRRRDGRGAAQRRDRRREQRSRRRVRPARERWRGSRPSRATRARSRSSRSTAATA